MITGILFILAFTTFVVFCDGIKEIINHFKNK